MTRLPHNLRRQQDLAAWLATRVSLSIAIAAALFIAVQPAHAGEMRTWSSSSGAHKTEAEFVEVKDDGVVVLKSKAGKTIEVPLSRLSEGDQAYARSRAAAKAPTSTKADAPKSVADVESEALQCKTAKEAVMVYKFYLAKPNLTAEQRAEAETNF